MTANDELYLLLRRANDAVKISEEKYMVKTVGFLTPAERVFLQKNADRPQGGRIIYFGGYAEAERTLFAAVPEYIDDSAVRDETALLSITGRNLENLTHRDFLGSLMGLGIKREMVGDILVLVGRCLIFVRREIAPYILSNLDRIGRDGVKIEIADVKDIEIPPKKTEVISGTVAGIRLDSVLSVACKTSRAKAAEYITGGAVSVNWEETENVSKGLKEDDVISVKGKGRFKVSRIGGVTKKGRFSVTVEKYI